MIIIDEKKCIGCGLCVSDCFAGLIKLQDGIAVHAGRKCMDCGHCLAICPQNAVSMDDYDMDEVKELSSIEQIIKPDVYLNHLKARRTIRQFTNEAVSDEEIRKILEAGRFSPTGGNAQNVSYYVARKDAANLCDMVYEKLNAMGEAAKVSKNMVSGYEMLWLKMYKDYKKNGNDKLFFNSDAVILVSAPAPAEAIIAAAHMETMVYSLGLGMLYSGFTSRAINESPEIKEHIQLKEGNQVYAVLVIGHPKSRYVRTVPRKEADVIWN